MYYSYWVTKFQSMIGKCLTLARCFSAHAVRFVAAKGFFWFCLGIGTKVFM